MNLIDVLKRRYSTKEFDTTRKINKEDFEKIKALLQLSPSSTNMQPWHFIIAGNEDGKKRMAKGTQGFFQFNEQKIMDASHVVIFCSKIDTDAKFMNRLLEKEDQDGRYPNEEVKQMVFGARGIFSDIHKYDLKDQQHWMEKQVYLNMGSLLLGVATLGIDALPMEGLDFKVIDQEFRLRENGFTSIAAVSLGYHKESDFNAITPKSRLTEEEIFTIL